MNLSKYDHLLACCLQNTILVTFASRFATFCFNRTCLWNRIVFVTRRWLNPKEVNQCQKQPLHRNSGQRTLCWGWPFWVGKTGYPKPGGFPGQPKTQPGYPVSQSTGNRHQLARLKLPFVLLWNTSLLGRPGSSRAGEQAEARLSGVSGFGPAILRPGIEGMLCQAKELLLSLWQANFEG